MEIDLSKPLKWGFWIGNEESKCMVAIFYEHLPTFCYKCGLVGYSEGGCSFGLGDLVSRELDSDLGGLRPDHGPARYATGHQYRSERRCCDRLGQGCW